MLKIFSLKVSIIMMEFLANIKEGLAKNLWIIIVLLATLFFSYSYLMFHSGEKSAEYGCLEKGVTHTQKKNIENSAEAKRIYNEEVPPKLDALKVSDIDNNLSELGIQ